MAKKKGRELKFSWDNKEVGNITSLNLNIDGEIIDVSDWDSGDWKDKIAGRKDWTIELGLYHNSETTNGQDDVETDVMSKGREGAIKIAPASPTAGDISWAGNVIIASYNIEASGSDEAVTSSLSLEGNGALTRTVQGA